MSKEFLRVEVMACESRRFFAGVFHLWSFNSRRDRPFAKIFEIRVANQQNKLESLDPVLQFLPSATLRLEPAAIGTSQSLKPLLNPGVSAKNAPTPSATGRLFLVASVCRSHLSA